MSYSSRKKRRVFNGAGSLLRWAIGVTDNEKETEMDENIKNVQEKTNELNRMMGNQIRFMETTYDLLNKTTTDANLEGQHMLSQMVSAQERIRIITGISHQLQIEGEISQILALIIMEAGSIEQQQREPIEVITALQNKQLHPLLLDATELMGVYSNMTKNFHINSGTS